MSGCPNCCCEGCGWDEPADVPPAVDWQLEAALCREVDQAVNGYRTKLDGRKAWVDFAALLPAELREES